MLEMEEELQLIDISTSECGKTLVEDQIELISRAKAKTPVTIPTAGYRGVST